MEAVRLIAGFARGRRARKRAYAATLLFTALAVAPSAHATTRTFAYTGAEQLFQVPAGLRKIHVVAIGGQGGSGAPSGSTASGGLGAIVTAVTSVKSAKMLFVEVGGNGSNGDVLAGSGGFNGGGAGGPQGFYNGGGGGGASDLRTMSFSTPDSLASRLLVAAGGGGSGGASSQPGGDAGQGGAAGDTGGGGGAGSLIGGGGGGGDPHDPGHPGAAGVGGEGGGSDEGYSAYAGGGGGGGGYYGGGGGGGGGYHGGGGGGGASLVTGVGSSAIASVGQQPRMEISYDPPPDTQITKAKIKAAKHRARFRFGARGASSGLECALVHAVKRAHHKRPAFKACASPRTYSSLRSGSYKFEVRAVNADGRDPTPATKSFKI